MPQQHSLTFPLKIRVRRHSNIACCMAICLIFLWPIDKLTMQGLHTWPKVERMLRCSIIDPRTARLTKSEKQIFAAQSLCSDNLRTSVELCIIVCFYSSNIFLGCPSVHNFGPSSLYLPHSLGLRLRR